MRCTRGGKKKKKKNKIEKNTVQETLVIPLYGRKLCTEQFPDLFQDKKAVELVAALVSGDYAKGADVKKLATEFLLIKRDDFGNAVYEYLRRR